MRSEEAGKQSIPFMHDCCKISRVQITTNSRYKASRRHIGRLHITFDFQFGALSTRVYYFMSLKASFSERCIDCWTAGRVATRCRKGEFPVHAAQLVRIMMKQTCARPVHHGNDRRVANVLFGGLGKPSFHV